MGICLYHIYFRPKISAACFKMSFSIFIADYVWQFYYFSAILQNGYLFREKEPLALVIVVSLSILSILHNLNFLSSFL